MLTGIAACVFDAYGTLFDVRAISERCHQALGDRADRLLDLWRMRQLEYSWLRSLMRRYDNFWHVTGESLDWAMAALDIAPDPRLRSQLMDGFLAPKPFPEVTATLERLHAGGIKTAILSNGSPAMLVMAAKTAGLDRLLHALLSVDTVGCYKPDPAVYQLAVDRFGKPADTIAFFSANGWDAAGAAAFGFRSVWVNRGGAPRERLPGELAAEFHSLAELPALLGL